MRCLRKDPAERFQSMAEVRAVLAKCEAKPAEHQASIAVLPFANMSRDADDEYFSDGLAEEIINALVKIRGLKVIARTSSFAFKGQNTDIRSIAEVLGVTNVLEGSVRRSGNRIRVTAQLIAAADGSHIWSERYDRQMQDLFEMQDEIATAIASELKVKFAPHPTAHPRRQPKLQAYEAYLRYRHYQWALTPDRLRRSRECLEQAIALDPEFALPYVGLADHHLSSTMTGVRYDDVAPLMRTLTGRALELDPELSEAHGMMGILAGVIHFDWVEAGRCFRRAMAREPVPWHVRAWYSCFYLLPLDRAAEARREAERALEDDPLSAILYWTLSLALDALGLKEEALAARQRVVELDPDMWIGWYRLAMSHAVHGNYSEARPCAERAFELFPTSPSTIGVLAGVLRKAGEIHRADELLLPLPDGAYGTSTARMCSCLVAGDIEAAVEWAAKAVAQNEPLLITNVLRPFQGVLRKSQGWPALLKQLNLTEDLTKY